MDPKHLMWLLMKREIMRYLNACADEYENGAVKAEVHFGLSSIFVAGYCMCEIERAANFYYTRWSLVHDKTQELTDYLDEEIGFPRKGDPDYEELAPKFFDKFYDIAKKALDDAENEGVKELDYSAKLEIKSEN
jgi:hypothetical protein